MLDKGNKGFNMPRLEACGGWLRFRLRFVRKFYKSRSDGKRQLGIKLKYLRKQLVRVKGAEIAFFIKVLPSR